MENTKPITPKGLPKEIVDLLNERIGDEYTAYYFYRNAANWCENANYKKAAGFFEKEAAGELGHSKGLQEYLTQWNHVPASPQVPTQVAFASLVDIINQAYVLEYNLLEKYSADQVRLFNMDSGTFNFIQQYVDYQVNEVKEYSDLLNATVLVNTENKFEVLYFEQTYF